MTKRLVVSKFGFVVSELVVGSVELDENISQPCYKNVLGNLTI